MWRCRVGTARIGLVVAVVVGLTAAGGCGDSGEPDVGIPGAYALTAIAAQSLPFAIIDFGNGDKVEITGGGILLNADGTFSQTLNSTSTFDGTPESISETRDGTYVVTGTSITLNFSDNESLTGSIDGITLTVTVERVPWTFRK